MIVVFAQQRCADPLASITDPIFFVCLLSLMLQVGRATQEISDKYVASHDGSVVP